MAVQFPSELHPIRARLLAKAGDDAELYALGASVARVTQMAADDEQGANELAHVILSDAALSTRVLRMANGAMYRSSATPPVTTVSRALSLLGFNTVRRAALGMLLVDALGSRQATGVRGEIEVALLSSLVGRAMARRSSIYQADAEEASVVSLLKNIAPLLVASHENDTYREIADHVASGRYNHEQAASLVLGCGYEALTQAVAQSWKLAPQLVLSMAPQPTGPLSIPAGRTEWMAQVACFGTDLGRLAHRGASIVGANERALLSRYGRALAIDAEQLSQLLAGVKDEMAALLASMKLVPTAQPAQFEADTGTGLPAVLQEAMLDIAPDTTTEFHPSGKPTNARDLLLAGVQDVTQMRAAGKAPVNELILAVLESLYSSMGFRFATVCLKDPKTNTYRARAAFGAGHGPRQQGFQFPLEASRDLFHLAMEHNADMMVADAKAPKLYALLPQWHRELLPDAHSLIVLPLVVGKARLGLFYADRTLTAFEGVPPDETALIKALKGQVLAALGG
jgi:HD-like signal output (HDOD) protein